MIASLNYFLLKGSLGSSIYYIIMFILLYFREMETSCVLWWCQAVCQPLEVTIVLQCSRESPEVQFPSNYQGPDDAQAYWDY